jgi:hypothetical protein
VNFLFSALRYHRGSGEGLGAATVEARRKVGLLARARRRGVRYYGGPDGPEILAGAITRGVAKRVTFSAQRCKGLK